MKIERTKRPFTPLLITLETCEDQVLLAHVIGYYMQYGRTTTKCYCPVVEKQEALRSMYEDYFSDVTR